MCIKLPVPATSNVLVKKQGYCGKLTYMRCVRGSFFFSFFGLGLLSSSCTHAYLSPSP
jgi:hypothetical protein